MGESISIVSTVNSCEHLLDLLTDRHHTKFTDKLSLYFSFKGKVMNKKLYVGNLSYTVTEGELHTHFSTIGPVSSATLITDRDTGRSKGFGFVEMETDEAAAEAIRKLNNTEMSGRMISVSEARRRPDP